MIYIGKTSVLQVKNSRKACKSLILNSGVLLFLFFTFEYFLSIREMYISKQEKPILKILSIYYSSLSPNPKIKLQNRIPVWFFFPVPNFPCSDEFDEKERKKRRKKREKTGGKERENNLSKVFSSTLLRPKETETKRKEKKIKKSRTGKNGGEEKSGREI